MTKQAAENQPQQRSVSRYSQASVAKRRETAAPAQSWPPLPEDALLPPLPEDT